MPLSHTILESETVETSRYVLFLHGILGSKANWRSIARRTLDGGSNGWGAVLVDLRMHGESQNATAPHTVESAADDLSELSLAAPVEAVLGHSFGGKVALEFASNHASITRALLVDSNPGARKPTGQGNALGVLSMLEELPGPHASREAFVAAVEKKGEPRGVAQWLAMNLEPDGDQFRFGLDLEAVRSLLTDYFAKDLWSLFESPRTGLETSLLIGNESDGFSVEDRERALSAGRRTRTEIVDGAGHWIHIDKPDYVVKWIHRSLSDE